MFEGDDLVVFDDQHGIVANIGFVTVDNGDGENQFIGSTGTLPVQDVLDMMTLLATTQDILADANDLIELVGATPDMGMGTNDIISNTFRLLDDTQANLIIPSSTYLSDVHDDLIVPTHDFVIEAKDILMPAALDLLADAYNDLIVEAMDFIDDQQANLVDVAQGLVDQADAELTQPGQELIDRATVDVINEGNIDFSNKLIELRDEAIYIAENVCPPEPDEPPVSTSNCYALQQKVDCMQYEIDKFVAAADLCLVQADLLVAASDSFMADVQANFIDVGAQTVIDADALNVLADAVVIQAEAFEVLAEDFRQRANDDLALAGQILHDRADIDILQVADGLALQATTEIEVVGEVIQLQAEQLANFAELIMDATLVSIESALGESNPNGGG